MCSCGMLLYFAGITLLLVLAQDVISLFASPTPVDYHLVIQWQTLLLAPERRPCPLKTRPRGKGRGILR